MGIRIISLPPEIHIPDSWLETPQKADRVNEVAQSRLADWTAAQLKGASRLLIVGSVISLIGVAVSIYFISVLGVVLCGACLTMCLIGKNAIEREKIARCQQTCLEVEDWLIQFEGACETLKERLQPFSGQFVEGQEPNFSDEQYQLLLEAIQDLPDHEKLGGFEKALRLQHEELFGEWRSIGDGKYSTHWITSYFKRDCVTAIDILYMYTNGLKNDVDGYKEKNERDMMYVLANSIHELLELRHQPLGARSEQTPRTLIELTEQWRQNIAAFRSSIA